MVNPPNWNTITHRSSAQSLKLFPVADPRVKRGDPILPSTLPSSLMTREIGGQIKSTDSLRLPERERQVKPPRVAKFRPFPLLSLFILLLFLCRAQKSRYLWSESRVRRHYCCVGSCYSNSTRGWLGRLRGCMVSASVREPRDTQIHVLSSATFCTDNISLFIKSLLV